MGDEAQAAGGALVPPEWLTGRESAPAQLGVDYQAWPWKLVATATVQYRPIARTLEAWVARRPAGWYVVTDRDPGPHGPYAEYEIALYIACRRIGVSWRDDETPEGARE